MIETKFGVTEQVRELVSLVARETASEVIAAGSGRDINYYRSTEMLLWNYKKLAALVADWESYMDQVFPQGHSASIILQGGKTSEVRQMQTSEEQQSELVAERMRSYQRTRAQFDELDRVIRQFRLQQEFVVIGMYYLGEDADGKDRPANAVRYTWEDIADKLAMRNICREAKTARRWRNKLVRDMSICLFGRAAAISAGIMYAEVRTVEEAEE